MEIYEEDEFSHLSLLLLIELIEKAHSIYDKWVQKRRKMMKRKWMIFYFDLWVQQMVIELSFYYQEA
jgi:hypothetical protein